MCPQSLAPDFEDRHHTQVGKSHPPLWKTYYVQVVLFSLVFKYESSKSKSRF